MPTITHRKVIVREWTHTFDDTEPSATVVSHADFPVPRRGPLGRTGFARRRAGRSVSLLQARVPPTHACMASMPIPVSDDPS